MANSPLEYRLQNVRLLATDIDGVLTDGSVIWGATSEGNLLELKVFNVKDGLGFGLVQAAGLEVAWITGRASVVVERRAAELKVQHVQQGVRNKRRALTELTRRLDLQREQVLYVGDDLNDLPAFDAAGVTVAVADAVLEVRQRADWVTQTRGGAGAIREVVERLLRAQGRWDAAVAGFFARLEQEDASGQASTVGGQ